MAEMSAKITLTFNDLGSPGLKALQALIEGLGPKVTGLSQRFNTLEKSIEKVGVAAQNTATRLGQYDAAINNTTNATNNATRATGGFEAAVAALSAGLRAMTTVMQGLVGTYNALGQAAQNVAGQMNAATGSLQSANTQLAVMQGRIHGVTDALAGMAQMWAAQKLFKAGGAAVNEAAEFQMLEARIKALNLPEKENQEMLQKSQQLAKEMRFVSTREALEARVGAITGIGRNTSELSDPMVNNIIEKTLPTALKTARLLQARGDTSEMKDIVRNLYGMVEARGQTSHPEAMNTTFDLLQRGLASTGSKVTIRDVEAAFRNMKYGSRSLIDDEGVTNVIAYINQLKASGHGGGGSGGQGVTQAGTMITMMSKFAEGGVKNKDAVNMLQTMGLFEGKVTGDTTTTSVNTGPKGLVHSDELLRDPIGWAMKYFAPAAMKFAKDNPDIYGKGKDLNDPRAMDEAIAAIAIRLFASQGGQNVGQGFAIAALPGPASQIQSENRMTKGAKGIDASMVDMQKTFNQNVKNWEAALHNLELALGQNLLPALTSFLDKAAGFITFLNEVANSHPTSTSITTIALAVGALALALSGLEKVFGIFTILRGWLAGLTVAISGPSAAAAGFGAAWVGASGVITGSLAVVGLAIRRAIPLFAAFLAGWDLGLLVSSWEVAGRSIGDWMQRLIGWLDQSVTKVKAFFGIISQEEAKLELQRKRSILDGDKEGPGKQGTGAKKMSAARPVGAPLSAAYSETPEERFRREKEAAASKLPDMKYTPLDKDANKHFFNPEASLEKNKARVAAAEEANMIRALDAAYHASGISIKYYYDSKLALIEQDGKKIRDALKAELAALEKPPKGKKDEDAINRVRADIKIQEIKEEAQASEIKSQREKALADLKIKIADAERQTDAGAGHRHLAEIKRIDEELDKKKQLFVLNGEIAAANAIEATRPQRHAAAAYDAEYRALTKQLDAFKQKEGEVTDSVKAGAITQAEAEHEVWEIRRKEGELIDSLIVKLRALADTSGDEKLIKQVGELARTAKADLNTLAPEAIQVKNIFGSAFSQMFESFGSNTKKAKAIILDFFSSIEKGVVSLISKRIADQLANSIFGGSGGGGGGGGIFGFLGNIVSGFGAGGGGGGPGIDIIAGGGSAILSAASGLDRVPADMLIQTHKDEAILTARDAAKYRAGTLEGQGGAGFSVTNNFFVSGQTTTKTQSQIAAQAAQSIKNAQRNL